MEITANNSEFDNDPVEDQESQQDVQSDGIEDIPASQEDTEAAERDKLEQADKAAEASFTLDVDKGIAPDLSDRGEESTNGK